MGISVQQVAAAGRIEADKMKSALANRGDAGRIAISIDQFATLAALMHVMSDLLDKPHPGSFGDPRYWVPLDALERKQQALQSLQQEYAELRRQTALSRPFPFES